MEIRIAKTIDEVRAEVKHARTRGAAIGFVPTMGALHAGHGSLVHIARREADFVVVSIFVNPTQFGPNEDFGRYPRTFDDDVALCDREGADLIFTPEVEEVYPKDSRTFVEVTGLQDGLCGAARPGHFRGVATVVLKLFNMVLPDVAFFGQKDAQQARIIQQMVRDLNVPVEIRICPIVREPDGLAMSSRNRYLSPEERTNATALFRALDTARTMAEAGERDPQRIRNAMTALIASTPGAVIDYVEIVDPESLQSVTAIEGQALALMAVRFGTTRLIDNMMIAGSTESGRNTDA